MIPKDDSLFSKMLANTFVLARVPHRNRTYKRIYMYIQIDLQTYTHTHTHTHTHNWFMQLWRLRNPKLCNLPAGDPGKLTKF